MLDSPNIKNSEAKKSHYIALDSNKFTKNNHKQSSELASPNFKKDRDKDQWTTKWDIAIKKTISKDGSKINGKSQNYSKSPSKFAEKRNTHEQKKSTDKIFRSYQSDNPAISASQLFVDNLINLKTSLRNIKIYNSQNGSINGGCKFSDDDNYKFPDIKLDDNSDYENKENFNKNQLSKYKNDHKKLSF